MRHHLEAATSEFAVTALAGKAWQVCRAGLSSHEPLTVYNFAIAESMTDKLQCLQQPV